MGSAQSTPRHVEGSCSRTGRPPRSATPLPPAFLQGMEDRGLAGEKLQLPGTPSYLENCVCWNHDAIGSPSALFVPRTPEDVSSFLRLYSSSPLPAPHSLSVSGGRHSHYGLKNDALVVDMSAFNKIEIDVERMVGRFGAGLKLKDIDEACFNKQVATTFGTNPDTGVAGLTLGGGFGWLARRHGLSVDNLLSARVVLASGEEVLANADGEHKELFFGIRGGGGNFGIVLEFEFRLYKRGPVIKGVSVFLTRKWTDVPTLLKDWNAYTHRAPDTVQCSLVLPCGGPVVLPFAYIGDDLAEGERQLAELRALGNPFIKEYGVGDYFHPSLKGKDLQSSAMAQQQPGNYYEAGVALTDLTPDVVNVLLKYTSVDSGLIPNKLSQIVIFALGGAIGRVSAEDCPVGFRQAGFVALVLGGWANQKSPEAYARERAKVQAWCRGTVRELCLHGVKSFYNVIGADAGVVPQPSDAERAHAAEALVASSLEEELEHSAGHHSPVEGSVAPSCCAASAAPSPQASPHACAAVVGEEKSKESEEVAPMHTAKINDERIGGIKSMYNFNGGVFERLQAIKKRYDPNNIFRNNNNILVKA